MENKIEKNPVCAEILAQAAAITAAHSSDNAIAAAKIVAGLGFFADNSNPALRERLVAIAAVTVAGLLALDALNKETVDVG